MTANTVLCVISTLGFCFGTQGLGWLLLRSHPRRNLHTQKSFSPAARNLARRYAIFSLFVLTSLSLAAAIKSYLELFT